jgi:PAS domain S-box-containing protein
MVYRFEIDQTGKSSFTFVSEGCSRIFSYDPEQVLSDCESMFRHISDKDRPGFDSAVQESHRNLSPFRWQGRLVDDDQKTTWVEAISNPTRLPGGTTRWDGVLIDITSMKQAERELMQAIEQAEQANHAKSEFLANMSHEIRTPLHGILSFSKFGLNKSDTADRAKVKDYFNKINTSGERLLDLVNDLLDLSKLEAGKMEFDFSEQNMTALIRCVVDEYVSLVSEREIEMRFDLPSNPLAAQIDQRGLMQVTRNLLGNALKFSPAKTAIEVKLETKSLQDGRPGAIVSIRDHGPGIPEDEIDLIFDKFVQSSKTKSGAGGTGLGLSICTEIMRGHGGRVWAENHPDGGAVFYYELPLRQDSQARSEKIAA